jgi:PKD repeat protein
LKKLYSFIFVAAQIFLLQSQCTYLAYDAFDYAPNIPLNGLSGGTGWAAPWDVQNGNTTVPGFSSVIGSMNFSNLQTLGNSASGGQSYLTMGRRLNTASNGPFQSFVAQNDNGIGTAFGDTLWTSFILSKQSSNDQSVFVSLHDSNLPWCNNCTSRKIEIGYFGAPSNNGGNRFWSWSINNTIVQSTQLISPGISTFFVVRMIFASGNTQVDLFINPSTIGSAGPPASPSLSQATGVNNVIRSAAVYLGDNHSNGRLDELRFAHSYLCVSPDPSVVVNLPPIASCSATPTTGQLPLNVAFNGSASFDPEGQPLSYVWNFGDGTPISILQNPSHIFRDLGQLTVSLTVTDNLGLSHTTYQTITVLNSNNTFPCQTTVSCLQMANCNSSNGRIRVNVSNAGFQLVNSANSPLPVTNQNEFHNLAPGDYRLFVQGTTSVCKDTMSLNIRRDSSTCPGWTPPNCTMEIGTNMSGFADWAKERPMKNRMKHIRSEVVTYSNSCNCWNANVNSQMAFDANGYPTFLPQTTSIGPTFVRYILSSDGGNLQADSTYVLLYDGVGTIDFGGGWNIQNNTANRVQFNPTNNGNIFINITQSTFGNHLRNFRLLRLADENANLITNPFYTVFKNKIAPFSVLRFMDWQVTNGSPNALWANRASTNFFTYGTEHGVPYETIIALANETQKDIWICTPHLADSTYVAEMATLFRNTLNPNSTIYLEYSNEVWNWIFAQAHHNDQNRPLNLSYGRAMAQKAGKVFKIWHDVFGVDKCRVKRVLGVQAGFNGLNEQILSQLDQKDWDYGSPTHYFGLDHESTGNPVLNASSTVQNVMDNAYNSFLQFKTSVKQDYNNILIFGKEVITYEGGQHFVGNSFGVPYPYQQSMWNAQNSPQMYELYDIMHDTIRSWGCKLATNFSLASPQESVYGSWGVMEHIDVQAPYSTNARKYQALLDNLPNAECFDRWHWTGASNSLWDNRCNWNRTRLPIATSKVYIPASVPNSPVVNVNSVVKSLRLALGATLQIMTGRILTVD